MSNVLNEQTKQQVIALGRLGWSLRRIQKSTGVRRETVAAYLREAGVTVRAPGRWGHEPASTDAGPPPAKPATEATTDSGVELAPAAGSAETTGADPVKAKPAIAVTTDSGAATAPTSASACAVHRDAIELGLARGRNAMAIWQDLVDTCGFTGGYQSVKRFVRKLAGSTSKEACAVIETAPGEEAQVDYGTGPMVRDPRSGKYRRMRLFVLTLGYSRKAVRLLVFQSSTQNWAELHEKAFRRLGGCTRVVVLDNLREGVLKPDIYDPTINPVYADMLRHYGVVAMPCRVRDPDRKGKVESSVGHAQKTPLKGMHFESPEEAQTYLDQWETRWADTRIHGTTKRQVAAMFAEERPALLPLPVEPFRYYQFGERTVHLDGCVEVEAAYYGVPPGWIGRRVSVQWDSHQVRLLNPATGQLLREHRRQPRGGHRIEEQDRPKHTPLGTQQLLCRADRAGEQIGALCRRMYQDHGQTAVRRILGMLSLAKKYGAASVDEACGTALEVGSCEYRFVRRYLERHPQMPLSLRQVDPLIRELTVYRDFIENQTKGD
ncbi:MAG: IS21 family transposase [Planctomycetota bacterium]|nr:MAG: IS21 family transposase [Planctomycetota bacterium]